jgi:hypothetical protein
MNGRRLAIHNFIRGAVDGSVMIGVIPPFSKR